ncbi:MAG: biopolymer transporter ExbD, partial [Myxococcales bacterium]|nr:biopolymer transporter ExbD [Myxococcales bacterium]
MALKLTTQQRKYVKKHSAYHEPDASELDDELNIIPFLDIVVNLIMFLLMVISSVAFFAQLDAALPTGARGGVGQRAAEAGQSLNLTITITPNGVIVAGSGAKMAQGCESTTAGRVMTVPTVGGRYDWAGLTTCAGKIKERFEDETRVTITA